MPAVAIKVGRSGHKQSVSSETFVSNLNSYEHFSDTFQNLLVLDLLIAVRVQIITWTFALRFHFQIVSYLGVVRDL